MPDILALDWEGRQIAGLDATIGQDRAVVRKAFRLVWPQNISPDRDPQRAGEWLRAQTEKLGVVARDVVVSIPREDAVVRRLQLPNVPDDELPEIVRLQAATHSTLELDQFLLDYLPMPERGEGDGRNVLMTTIPTALADRIQSALSAAQLHVRSIGLSPVASAQLIAHAERSAGDDPQALSLFVGRHGRRVEIAMMTQQRMVFSHSTQIHGENVNTDDQVVLAEINRSRFSLQEMLGEVDISRVWVLGTEREMQGLCASLKQRLQCSVRTLDPLAHELIDAPTAAPPQERAAFAGPVGLLLTECDAVTECVDFLNPRKTIVRTDPRRIRIAIGAAAALLLVAGGWVALSLRISNLDARLDERDQTLNELRSDVEKGGPALAAAELVRDWVNHRNDWLYQLERMARIMPDTERIYLHKLRFEPGYGEVRGRISANGLAKLRGDIHELERAFDEAGYQVSPQQIRSRTRDASYPLELNLELEIPIHEPEGPERPASGPAARGT